ncbi:Periplasmic serine endoprotease DegP [subsurface metagenome]
MGSHPERGKAEEPAPVKTIVIKDEGGFANSIRTVANLLMPTVVHIEITGTVVQRSPYYYFGQPQQREVPIRALGSGVIISSEGYIITNNHVVQNADTIKVELYDGSSQSAKFIGTDPNTDLAVIKIDPTSDMKYAKFGNSDEIQVGEWVVAIGSPRGFDWTVTAGIISGKHRRDIGALGPTGYEDFIQTDASINPGNSGGPLINLNGEVIGINSLIVSASRGSEGLGFSIPSNMVKTISESLIKHGKVVRGYLGVNIQSITPELIQGLKLERNFKGVIITNILPDSPASKAGFEQGDIIILYDGTKTESSEQLRNFVAATRPGRLVKVKVLRDNDEVEISVKIGDLENTEKQVRAKKRNDLLGLTVEKVTPEIARNLGLRRAVGVIVTDIHQGSTAARVGISNGDIIFRVGNREVNDTEEFSSLISEAVKEGSVMLLLRDGKNGRVGYIIVPLK